MVKSSKTSFINIKRQCTGEDVSAMIYTGDQSINNQPVLWVVHGSGGVSSSEDIFRQWAEDHPGVTIVIVDSYSGRQIFKPEWDGNDDRIIDSHTRAEDQIAIKMKIDKVRNKIFPFMGNKNYMVGFSDGGSTVMRLLTDRYHDYSKWVDYVYPCYPSLHPYESDWLTLRGYKCHIFVGEKDNWTPAKHCQRVQQDTDCKLTILPETHHSFCKPGVKGWHKHVINISSIDLPMTDSEVLKENYGNFANFFGIDYTHYKGVYSEYNPAAVQRLLLQIEEDMDI